MKRLAPRARSAGRETSTEILTAVATRALALQEVALALARGGEIGAMATEFLPVVAAAVGSREAALFVLERDGTYGVAALHGVPEELREEVEERDLEQVAAGIAAEAEAPVIRSGIAEDESFLDWCESQELDPEARRPYFELYAPLPSSETVVGVLALGRRADGADFSDDDLSFVEHVASSAAVAVSRTLLERENQSKIELLRALSRFTGEITSTLDLNRVLQTVANTTEAVIERDRALVALLTGGGLRVRAVSDKVTVEVNEAEVLGIGEVLRAIQRRGGRIRVTGQLVEDQEAEVPDREVFARYFEAGEMQSILALPLQDEESLLGYLVLESRNPDGFGDPNAEEFLGILSGSVTVAIRNADLYRRVPMVGLLGPIASQRRRLAAMSPRRRWALLTGAGGVAIFIAFVPIPRDVAGPAVVRPAEVLPVTAQAPGVVERIWAASGQEVVAGAVVASLRNPETDARLAAAEAELAIAERRAAEAVERRDPAEAQRWALQAKHLSSWLAYAREEGRDQRLDAPVSGSILTPRLEERVGERLERGDILCEIARLDPAHVDVLVLEEDLGDLRPGRQARVKVLAYPARQFRGAILSISPEGTGPAGKPAAFTVTVECANPDLQLLAGMTGRAKLEANPSPWLWNMLRPLARAVRMTLWF